MSRRGMHSTYTDTYDRGLYDILTRRRQTQAHGITLDLDTARQALNKARERPWELDTLRDAAIDEAVAAAAIVCSIAPVDYIGRRAA